MESVVDSLTREISLRGKEQQITKDILKVANAKLILSDEYKHQYESYRELYKLKLKDSYLQDSIINRQLNEIKRITLISNRAITSLNAETGKATKYKKQRNTWIGISAGLTIIAAILIK